MEAIGFASDARIDFEYGQLLPAFIEAYGSYGARGIFEGFGI
jgi:hypothetical protein